MATRRRAFGTIRAAGKTLVASQLQGRRPEVHSAEHLPLQGGRQCVARQRPGGHQPGRVDRPHRRPADAGRYVAGWLDRKQKVGHYRPRTLELVTGLLDRIILPALGQRELSEIKTPLVRSWHADVAAKHSPGQAAEVLPAPAHDPRRGGLGRGHPVQPLHDQGAGTEPAPERPKPTLEMIEAVVAQLKRPVLPPQPQAE